MTEEEKDTQTTPSEEAQTEPKIEESVTEPEVVETVPEIEPETSSEAIAEPVETAPETQTPQMGGNEPFGSFPKVDSSFGSDSEPKERQPVQPKYEGNEPLPEILEESTPAPEKEKPKPREREEKQIKDEPSQKEKLGLLRQMARATIQLRREKKLLKIMELFAKQTAVTNDEVEKLLHVSDATATRYLSELEKQGKLKQVGITGRGVSYIKR